MVTAPLVRLLWWPKVEGREHVPAHGPAILASNHLSVLDSFFLPALLRRPRGLVAKNESFPGTRLTATWMGAMGTMPIDRENVSAAQDMLDSAVEVLNAGEMFG